jgi:hypothetical protein
MINYQQTNDWKNEKEAVNILYDWIKTSGKALAMALIFLGKL